MPARSNEFQELVSLVQTALAPVGAKMTSSAMVEVAGLKTLREVDVLIEGEFGPFKMKIAVEAKDEGRKLSLGTFDSIVGRYRGKCRVLVDKIVIVARAGFTKGVVEKAERIDVELLTLAEAYDKDWTATTPQHIHFKFAPHLCWIRTVPELPAPYADKLKFARLLCACCSRDLGGIWEFMKDDVFRRYLPCHPDVVRQLDEAVISSPDGQATATLSTQMCNRKLRIDDAEFPVESVSVGLHAVSAVGRLNCRSYSLTSNKGVSRRVTRFDAVVAGRKLDLVMPDGLQSEKIVLRLNSLQPDSKKGISAKNAANRVEPGRNSQCPCGSGRKYKRCCDRAGN